MRIEDIPSSDRQTQSIHESDTAGTTDDGGQYEIELTKFRKIGGPLTKLISLDKGGKPNSDGSACKMHQGKAWRVRIPNLAALASIIVGLKPEEAIALGRLRDDLGDDVRIVTDRELGPNDLAHSIIARTQEYIGFIPGQPALLLIDFDQKGMPDSARRRIAELGGLQKALESVCPALAAAGCVIRKSTSAGLYHNGTGDRFAESGGVHIYCVVVDGTDIGRFLKTLQQRCWLVGLGWMLVNKVGGLLTRSLIDISVGAPERLVFEGPPTVEPPLAQDQAARIPEMQPGPYLDTRTACPPMTAAELAECKRLETAERQRLAPEAMKVREQYAVELSRKENIPIAAAQRIAERQCNLVLMPTVELEFDDDTTCTVGDVLVDPDRYINETLCDPNEGTEYGTGKAKVLRGYRDHWPFIKSFAHGDTYYQLRHNIGTIEAAMRKGDPKNAADILATMLLHADVNAVEKDHLCDKAKELAKTTKTAVKKLITQKNEDYGRDFGKGEHDEKGEKSAIGPLNKDAPLDSARAFAAHRQRPIVCHTGDFYEWRGSYYHKLNDADVRSDLYAFLERAGSFPPTKKNVDEVFDALMHMPDGVHVPSENVPPCWIRGDHPTDRLIACRNGLVRLSDGKLLPHTPDYFNTAATKFDYNPEAGPPIEWLKFLKSNWPHDQETIDTLQEMFGDTLSGERLHQKIFLLIGPARSGKGTIRDVMIDLLGGQGHAGLTMETLNNDFGLETLLGKMLIVIPDARIQGRSSNVIVQRLLAISGQDPLTILRKYKGSVTVLLPGRIMIMTNELPELHDTSGTIASRFIVLPFTISWLGREDTGLKGRLAKEHSGIFNWALEGYRRLNERGSFIQPSEGAASKEMLAKLSSQMMHFIKDRYEFVEGSEVPVNHVYDAYCEWWVMSGQQPRDPPNKISFGIRFSAAFPYIRPEWRERIEGGKRFRWSVYVGLRPWPPEDDGDASPI